MKAQASSRRGSYIKDLKMCLLKGVAEIEDLYATGTKNRSVGATLMNAGASASQPASQPHRCPPPLPRPT